QGIGDEYLYAGGIWVGAKDYGMRRVSTSYWEFENRPHATDPVQTIYKSSEGMNNGKRHFDDDKDGMIDEERRNGRDDDNDGLIDEDFAAISEQMFSSEYNDYQPEAFNNYPEHVPLYLDFYQESYAWSDQGDFYIYHFEITNNNDHFVEDAYAGFYMDFDVVREGVPEWRNDNAEFNDFEYEGKTLSIAYTYDAEGFPNPTGYVGLLLLGYGITEPAADLKNHDRWSTHSVFSAFQTFPGGDPRDDWERYTAMSMNLGNVFTPTDVRQISSVGPFRTFDPGEMIWVDMAIVIGEGQEGMLESALSAKQVYESGYNVAVKESDAEESVHERSVVRVLPDDSIKGS
ncbi:MAG: hypothetical protein ABIH34_01015, partial [Nanoarchaeota archaeon]